MHNNFTKVGVTGNYKYRLTKTISLDVPRLTTIGWLSNEYIFDWATIKNGVMTVHEGYEWDGCSPKKRIFGKLFGTPDGRKDELLCQYRHSLPYLRKCQCTKTFEDYLKLANWKFTKIYTFAVDKFGPQDFFSLK
jgi:hypothetical protein